MFQCFSLLSKNDFTHIDFAAVGGGDHSEFKEIEAMATDMEHVFRVRDLYSVQRTRAKILEKLGLRKYNIHYIL